MLQPAVRRRAALLLTALTLAACAPSTSGPDTRDAVVDGAHPYAVRVRNDAGVALTAVRILTSEADTIDIAHLGRGATSGAFGVERLHEAPLVRLTAAGRERLAHPVEGFVEGFNPLLERGRYLIRLDVDAELAVRVERLP